MKEKWTRVKAAVKAAWHVLRGRITVESVDRLVELGPEGAHVRKTAKGYSRRGRPSRGDGYMGPMPGDTPLPDDLIPYECPNKCGYSVATNQPDPGCPVCDVALVRRGKA